MGRFDDHSLEVLVAGSIAFLLVASLLSLEFFSFLPSFTVVVLLGVLMLVKIVHIIRRRGTTFEDYLSLLLLFVFAVLRFFTVGQRINTTIVVIGVLITLFSIGVIPSTRRISNSKGVFSFILSYLMFIFAIIFLFSGTYALNSDLFLVNDVSSEISFTDALYFSTITFTTVGFGDIAPLGVNRLLASAEALIAITINIGFIGYILASKRFQK
jgi:hypothetical protein